MRVSLARPIQADKPDRSRGGFDANGFAVLRGLVNEQTRRSVEAHLLALARGPNVFTADPEVPGTPAGYGDRVTEALLESVRPTIEHHAGLMLDPTYSYFRVYKYGDSLRRHTDRAACEISLSLCVGRSGNDDWGLWIEPAGAPLEINLSIGDALLYRGIEIPHWRGRFTGSWMAQVFLHYVDRNGPHAHCRFDHRSALGEASVGS